MGGGHTKAEEDYLVSQLYTTVQSDGLLPDIGVDQTLIKFSGLDSADVLKGYTSELQRDLALKAPAYLASLGTAVASLSGVPNAVGLGALMVSFLLDVVMRTVSSRSEVSTLNLLRRVFAEEKASSVRDTMDECLKRLGMNMREPSKALEEITVLEKQLSSHLTRLKNSMLHDHQISSRAMKHWTNGAAFHSQMLIHAARLEATVSRISQETQENREAAIGTVLDLYRHDLQELLKKYKTYKRSTIFLWQIGTTCQIVEADLGKTTEHRGSPEILLKCDLVLDSYISYMFDTWEQLPQLDRYFSDLKKNIKELIEQHQSFTVKIS